ncbi:MAG: hypothetical protein CMJ67_02625 [Planctomycetaceae bacterium]|nr:hypothetical protein [Planctomycetaceae bacterium]
MFALLAQTSDKQAQEVIERGLELLSTPGGVGAVAVLTILLAGGVVTQSGWRWLLISLLVLATLIQGSTKYFNNTLFPPLEQLRSGSQVLNALVLGAIALATSKKAGDSRWKLVGAIAIAMLCFELFFGLRLFFAGRALRGALVLVMYVLLFVAIPVGVGRRLQKDEDFESLIRAIGLVGLPYILFNLLQYFYAPGQTVTHGRFAGVSGNPQSAGLIFSLLSITIIWLISRPRSSRWVLPAFLIAIGIGGLLLIWTGSRTSVLATAVGVAVMFRKRLGSMILVGGFVLAAVFVASFFLADGEDILERVQSTENTRAAVWLVGLQEFLKYPIFGTLGMGDDADLKVVESTPIQTLQVLGVVGFAFLFCVYLAIGSTMLRLLVLRKQSPKRGPLIDYVLGAWSTILIMSLFEAVFLGVITFFTITIYLLATMSAYLLDPMTIESQGFDEDEDEFEYEDEYEDEYEEMDDGHPSPA